MKCEICGQEKLDRDMSTLAICKACVKKQETEENVLKFGKKQTMLPKEFINRFYAFVFHNKIEDILAKEWQAIPQFLKELYIEDFCDENWDFETFVIDKLTKESEEI